MIPFCSYFVLSNRTCIIYRSLGSGCGWGMRKGFGDGESLSASLTQLECFYNFVNYILCNFVTTRNLSGNPEIDIKLRDLADIFPRLKILDITETKLNVSYMLNSRMLQIIRGTPLDGSCLRCYLRKRVITNSLQDLMRAKGLNSTLSEMQNSLLPPIRHPHESCYTNEIDLKYGKYLNNDHDKNTNLTITCVPKNIKCFQGWSQLPQLRSHYNIRLLNSCWNKIQYYSVVLAVVALIGISVNAIVVIVTARSKELRKRVAQYLVSFVALGDLVMCCFLLSLVVLRLSLQYQQHLHLQETHLCIVNSSMFLMSQWITGLSSFTVTVERYLVIVYAMKPDRRIFPSMANKLVILIILVSLLVAVLPLTALRYYYMCDSHWLPVHKPWIKAIQYSTIPGLILGTLYVLTVPMYIHIYKCTKRSSQTMAIKRESKVALRISAIVLSNFVFLLLPVLAVAVISETALGHFVPLQFREIFIKTFVFYCFGINACMNPVLFAFRNDRFRSNLRKQLNREQNAQAPN